MSFAPSQLKQRLLKGLGANAYGQLVTIGIQLLSVPLFLYYWGAEQYGEWLILAAIPAYLSLSDIGFATVAANDMTMRIAREDNEGAIEIYQSGLAFICCVCCVIFVILLSFLFLTDITNGFNYKNFSNSDVRYIIVFLSAQALISLVGGMHNAGFRASGLYATGTFFTNSIRLSEWVIAALLVMQQSSGVVIALWIAIVRVIGTILMQFCLLKMSPWINLGFKKAKFITIKGLIKPSFGFMAFPLGYAFSIQGTTLALGHTFGASTVAIFTSYRTLTRLTVQAVNILSQAMAPEISASFGEGNLDNAKKMHIRGFQINLIIGLFCTIFMLIFGMYIIQAWTHNRLPESPWVFNFLLFAALATAIWQSSWSVLLSTNNHLKMAAVFLVCNLLGVIGIYLNIINPWVSAMIIFIVELPILFYAIYFGCKVLNQSPLELMKIKMVRNG